MKKNFQEPQARVYEVIEESALLTPSINIVDPTDEKIEDSEDIGFSRGNITRRLGMILLFVSFTYVLNAQVIIEAPHNRTVSNTERTMYYNITAKNAGTLSAEVATDASAWLTASISGKRLTIHVAKNSTASTRYGNITISGSADASVTQVLTIAQNGDEYSGAALSSFEDTKYTISTGTATSSASESAFTKSYDGDYSTFWHSAYSSGQALANGGTVTATWDLGSSKSVDFITYTPRTDGSSNGHWGAFTLQYSTNNSSWTTIGSYDFEKRSSASSVDFSAVTARYIRVVISSGYNNHASCSEFVIGKRNTSAGTIAESLFEDDLWTELKSSVTQTTINNVNNSFIKTLAQAIKDGGYSTTYRVHTAKCFKSPQTISNEWNAPGKYYDRFGNVTGISVKKNSKIAIWIPNIPSGATVGLSIVSWFPGKYPSDTYGTYLNDGSYDPIITSYGLHEGMNIIEYNPTTPSGATASAVSDGLAYVTYFADTDGQYADVPMHFLNGIENGYLSLDLTNDEMHILCKNAPNMHMDVVTDHAHMIWESQGLYKYCRSTTRSGSSSKGTSKGYRQYIRAIEYIIGSEHEALGLQKYNHVPNTRALAYVNYKYYMFQGELGVSFCYDVQETCLDLYQMLIGNGASVWGISHEWGHQHQMRPYFNWAGCDEATNNYNSMWNTVRFGLTDTGHGCHPAFGTELYNGTVTSNLTANDKTVYTTITNARDNAYSNKSDVSWNSYFTTLVNDTYNSHRDWTAESNQSVYSFDFTNYCTARPFIAISFYAISTLGISDFSYDLFEALRQTDRTSGNTIVGSSIEKNTGVDKYELLAAAQNGNTTACSTFRSTYSSSVWTTKNYINSSHLGWSNNSVPFILNYIRKASRLCGYNLFPYFEKCGLLRQVAYRTFGGAWYLMTADMYTEFQNDMNALGLSTCDDNRVKAILQVANPNWTMPASINNN